MPDKPFDPIPTRHSLLARLKHWGDQTSWQEFFDTYWQLIYNVAVKAGLTDTEAQEVVQETVIAVAKKIPEFKADPARGSFSAWLMQLTRWRIADQFRKRQTMPSPNTTASAGIWKVAQHSEETDSTATVERLADPAGVALEGLWQEEWEKQLMAAAFERVKRQVSPRQYQMFDLHVLQKLSARETARTVQASLASVYMAKYRIATLVKKEVNRLQRMTR